MRETVAIRVDGRTVAVPRGVTVAAALLGLGIEAFRTSVAGEPRGPLCGMGICFECRVSIDGLSHQRACLTLCRDGMDVVTRG
ncbi:MAG TPA: (2Fe-2S)-binding protein [Thermoanaerobaculia bacterium]|nr:(2Fe-2S)-binding protein [Thermoanaerobaculia bacterium]